MTPNWGAESDDQNPYRSPTSGRHSADAPELPRTYMPGELFVVSSFKDSVEAHLFKNELENNGIKASIDSETVTALFSGPSSIFWTEVLVMGSDSERALEIKKKWRRPQFKFGSAPVSVGKSITDAENVSQTRDQSSGSSENTCSELASITIHPPASISASSCCGAQPE